MRKELTSDQLIEFGKCKNSPTYFINNYVYCRNPFDGLCKLRLYPFQETIISNYFNKKNNIVNHAR